MAIRAPVQFEAQGCTIVHDSDSINEVAVQVHSFHHREHVRPLHTWVGIILISEDNEARCVCFVTVMDDVLYHARVIRDDIKVLERALTVIRERREEWAQRYHHSFCHDAVDDAVDRNWPVFGQVVALSFLLVDQTDHGNLHALHKLATLVGVGTLRKGVCQEVRQRTRHSFADATATVLALTTLRLSLVSRSSFLLNTRTDNFEEFRRPPILPRHRMEGQFINRFLHHINVEEAVPRQCRFLPVGEYFAILRNGI